MMNSLTIISCATCLVDPDSAVAKAQDAAVLVMLAVLAFGMITAISFILYFIRKHNNTSHV
jgi:energy-converting hydrogenase Eha subunit C